MIPSAGNKMWKLFLVWFRSRHCRVSVIMRPSGYFVGPNLAHGAIWVWDPCSRHTQNAIRGPHHFLVLCYGIYLLFFATKTDSQLNVTPVFTSQYLRQQMACSWLEAILLPNTGLFCWVIHTTCCLWSTSQSLSHTFPRSAKNSETMNND